MYILKNRLVAMMLLLMLVISALGLVPILAQSNDIVLTVHVEEWQQNFFNDDMFTAFEEAHPGVKVVTVIIPQDERYFPTPASADDVPEFLENAANVAAQADLLQVQSYSINRMMTRAGAYLDITPLLNADMDANLEDFYPVMLQSFQWDGGTWALPVAGSVQILIYDQTRFDEAGLSYPDETWTLDDYLLAGRELTVYNANGEVETPGFFGFDTAMFMETIYGHSVTDPTAFPSQPLLTDPVLAEMVGKWAAFQEETNPETYSFDFQQIPMTFQQPFLLQQDVNFGNSDAVWKGALLSGGTAGIQTQGYAISAGTQYPELSYELLQFMTQSPDITYTFFGSTPARQSMQGVLPDDMPVSMNETSPEVQDLIDEALTNAIPTSERDLFSYVYSAMDKINSDGVDAETALLEAQEEAITVLNAIDEQAGNTVMAVATPVPTPILTANEVSLNFGIEAVYMPLPNRDLWDDAINEFVEQDPQVGYIALDTQYMSLEDRAEEQDCFYLGSNVVQQVNLGLLYSLDPFLSADPNFDPNEIMNGAILQLTRENAIWAIPLSLDPDVIWYDPNAFAEVGLPEPSNDWTVFEFIDALQQLETYLGQAPYSSQGYSGSYIYMLAAAFGGELIDASNPLYTIQVDDPNNVEAIRQVLDLARDGYIDYRELGNFGGGGGGSSATVFDAQLQPYGYRFQNRGEEYGDPHRVVLFPRGTSYTPVSYTLGGGYISANTAAPEACYRFLSFISQKPELLFGIPASRSLFDAAVGLIDDSSDLAELYRAFDAALQEPNLVLVTNPFNGGAVSDPTIGFSNFLTTMWLNRAFDRYVLEDADLDSELAQAQQFSEELQACVADVPPPDKPFAEMSNEESQSYFEQIQDCATGIDPSLNELFGGGGGGD